MIYLDENNIQYYEPDYSMNKLFNINNYPICGDIKMLINDKIEYKGSFEIKHNSKYINCKTFNQIDLLKYICLKKDIVYKFILTVKTYMTYSNNIFKNVIMEGNYIFTGNVTICNNNNELDFTILPLQHVDIENNCFEYLNIFIHYNTEHKN